MATVTRGDPATLLCRALFRQAGSLAPMLAHEGETPWSSATFVGAQHRVRVVGVGLEAWLAALPEADLPVRGHLVASVEVAPLADGALLTVLILEA